MFRLATKNNSNKLQRLIPQTIAVTNKNYAVPFAAQQRNINFISKWLDNKLLVYKTENLRNIVSKEPTERNLILYFQALTATNPKEVMLKIEKGWTNGTVPINEAFLKQYFKAAASKGQLDSVNITGLLSLLTNSSVNTGAAGAAGAMTEAELAALIRNSVTTLNSNVGMGGLGGRSPQEPIYVRQLVTLKDQGVSLIKFCLSVFVVFVVYNMITADEKAPGPGGAPSQGGLAAKLGLGGSIVKRVDGSDKTFADVKGANEAKEELEEIVMYLKDPNKFTRLGGQLPKGVLLTGPPGNGKTLLARAIAGEAKVPFFHASGSEFDEMFVGLGAKRIRELFAQARANSPSIIFIDEIDAVGGKRDKRMDSSNNQQTLNQLLVEMDGFQQNSGVIVIGATNLPDALDKALIRPGRFDKIVNVPLPDIGGRKEILQLYAEKVPMDKDVNLEQIARATPGFSGAELFNLINQAALKASMENHAKVGMSALEYAKDKIMMGAQRKSAVISPENMRLTAFHEAGHALMALKTDGANPIYKATIMPRGRALGMVVQLPDGDGTSMTRKQMLAYIDMCMGGRVAEELVFGYDNVTSGASADIQQATNLATVMVTKYGLSDKVGFISVNDDKCTGEQKKLVDSEINAILTESYSRARAVLTMHRKDLDIIAKGLLEYESLSGGEIVDLLHGKPLPNGVRSQKPSRAPTPLPSPAVAVIKTSATSGTTSSGNGSVGKGNVGSKV